jgi:hypothetical protein
MVSWFMSYPVWARAIVIVAIIIMISVLLFAHN